MKALFFIGKYIFRSMLLLILAVFMVGVSMGI